jgi:Tol biopolymer transport system component
VIALLIAALVVAAVLIGSRQRPLPPPFGLAGTGQFVYDANGDLFVRDADQQPRLLIGGPGHQFSATWSRDGSKVAFWSGEVGGVVELRVADTDGGAPVVIASGVTLPPIHYVVPPSWSPDGRKVAFSSDDGVLEVANVDGTGRQGRHVIGTGGLLRFDPAWSPDGSLIAFRGQEISGPRAPRNVYVIGADGKGERPVSARSGGFNAMIGPNWSVDGKLLYDAVYADSGAGAIVVATLAGDSWSENVIIKGEPDWLPRWSNDGTRIVFLRSHVDAEGDQLVANADGTGIRVISDRVMSTAAGCWTPDDRAIAALTGQEGLPIEGQPGAKYVLFDADSGQVLAEMPVPGIEGIVDCSWQRLAP